ncbi:MAG: GPP34 family phosphoprotein [Acidimicrobiia bacterium]|nr:GPP34 family phosphoprotein [Acidimicrobiia bacterium]
MLRFAEEVLLLLLRDEGGSLVSVPDRSLRYALAGGVLMDLALENRIDTDLENLVVLDDTPTGDELLDPTLAEITAAHQQHDTRFWLEHVADRCDGLRAAALARLTDTGILEERDDHVLWVFRSRRYPELRGEVRREVKLRLMEVLFSDEIPDPRDVMLIGLADACEIFNQLLSNWELEQVTPRIRQVRQLDLIGRETIGVIDDVRQAIAGGSTPHMH